MDSNNYNITPPPPPLEQPPATTRALSKKSAVLIFLCVAIIFASCAVIFLGLPNGPEREVQQIYKDLGGSDKFVNMRKEKQVTTSLLFEHTPFSPGEISVLGTSSTSGLIIMAGITIVGDTYTWRIETLYDGETYGVGGKTGMQTLTYSGKLSPAFFDADSSLTIEKKSTYDYIPPDFKNLLLDCGAILMAQALDDLNALMDNYSVRDLGFKKI